MFPLCEAPAVVFTDDSKSNSQDRRCTLRIGDVPLCASSWRRAAAAAARCLFYYDVVEEGRWARYYQATSRERKKKPACDLLLAAGDVVLHGNVDDHEQISQTRNHFFFWRGCTFCVA